MSEGPSLELSDATPAVVADETVTAEVWAGLTSTHRELSPKFFYDARGAALFEEITRLPEYYLTRTERALLDRWAPSWMARLAPRTIVELAAGSADKTRILLDQLRVPEGTYVPVDVSTAYLDEVARTVAAEYPQLRIIPVAADIGVELELPDELPRPALFVFLGSTIGNFDARSAIALLRRIAGVMKPGDTLLLGADLKKDRVALELAYNDARGITAEFNRNILRVLNRRAGTDFDIGSYDHLAYYAPHDERIEMHLVARTAQQVEVPGHGTVTIGAGESIRTEISCKYDRARIEELFEAAGLVLDDWQTDEQARYALALGRPRQ